MAIEIQAVVPPTKGRGRPKRLSDKHIARMLERVRQGEFATDGEYSKESAARQRGRAAKADLVAAGYEGELVARCWDEATDAEQEHGVVDKWRWAVGPK